MKKKDCIFDPILEDCAVHLIYIKMNTHFTKSQKWPMKVPKKSSKKTKFT